MNGTAAGEGGGGPNIQLSLPQVPPQKVPNVAAEGGGGAKKQSFPFWMKLCFKGMSQSLSRTSERYLAYVKQILFSVYSVLSVFRSMYGK